MLRRSVGVTKISRQMGIFDVLRKMSAVGCPSVHVSDGTSFTNWQGYASKGGGLMQASFRWKKWRSGCCKKSDEGKKVCCTTPPNHVDGEEPK